ncbi:hypothetical protein BH10CYA1_BH10CYA1_35110 [soil metagenome]
MLEFRQRLLLTTALASTVSYAAANAGGNHAEAPESSIPSAQVTEASTKSTESADKAAREPETFASTTTVLSAPIPGNLPQPGLHSLVRLGSDDDADEAIVLFPQESDEAINKANELHVQAAEAFKRNNIEAAIRFDEEASKAAPHYWMPHVALAYLYSNYKGGGPALEQAASAIKCEHPAMADNTHAALVATMRAFGSAMNKFKQLAAADPTSWRAQLGLASCYMNKGDAKAANNILDELSNANLKEAAAQLVIGNYYKKTGEITKAKEVLKRGLDNNPEPKIKEKLLIQLFEIAVSTDDRALISELKPKVASILDAKQRAWWRIGNIKLAQTPADARLALQLAESETVTDTEYRVYAKIFTTMATDNRSEQTAWLKLAKDAMTHALADHPAAFQNKVLLAALDEQLGDKQTALKIMKSPSPISQPEADSDLYLANYYKKMHKAQDDALAKLFIVDKDGYKCFAQAVDFKIPKANCRCKINSAKSIMKTLPGVLDVIVGPGEAPTATILFDNRRITREAIFQDQKIKNYKEKFEIDNERPVGNLVELAQIYQSEEQNPLAPSPSVQLVMLQYPTVQDAVAAVSVGSNPQPN